MSISYSINKITVTKNLSNAYRKQNNNLKQYSDNTTNGYISSRTKTKLKDMLSNWLLTEQTYIKQKVSKQTKNKTENSTSTATLPNGRAALMPSFSDIKDRLTFITLTFPTDLQTKTDTELKRQYLTPFLTYLGRHGVSHYFWVAETTAKDNLHFHLVINAYSHEYMEKWQTMTNNNTKYSFVERPINAPLGLIGYLLKCDNTRAIEGRIWGASATVKEFQPKKITNKDEQVEFMEKNSNQMTLKFDAQEYHIYKPKPKLRRQIEKEYLSLRKNQALHYLGVNASVKLQTANTG